MALLALDGTAVLVAAIGLPSALLIGAAALVSAVGTLRNGRQGRNNGEAVARVAAELRPNGGSSAFDKLSARLDAQDDDIADLKLAIGDIAGLSVELTKELLANKPVRHVRED